MTKTKKIIIISASVLILLTLSIIFIFASQSSQVLPVTTSSTLPDYSLEDLKANSSLIITGVVEEITDPFIVEADKSIIRIYRDCTIKPKEILRGEIADNTITVRTAGGKIDDLQMIEEGSPQLKVGEEYMLFLYQPNMGGDTLTKGDYYLPMGGVLGTFEKVPEKTISEISGITKFFDVKADALFISYLHTEDSAVQSALESFGKSNSSTKEYLISFSKFQKEMETFNEKIPVNENWYREDIIKNLKANLENGMLSQEEYDNAIAKMSVYGKIADKERTKELVREYTK